MTRIAAWAGIAMVMTGCTAPSAERPAAIDAAAPIVAGSAAPEAAAPPAGRRMFGGVAGWTPYRSFGFDANSVAMTAGHQQQVAEIAAFMEQNPTARLGLDASLHGQFTDRRDRELNERRAEAIRGALIRAGTPAARIETGAFGDPQLRREREVEVLVSRPR